MMPRIEAGETLAAIGRAALTNGASYESALDRQSALEEVRRKAAGEAPPKPVKANPDDLAGMGIAMTDAARDRPVIGNLEEWLGNG